jgi:8-oxo-dGTP pyrophosphatase MutT (NUDIX family)
MGRRSSSSRFMPGVYVFPGGRAEPSDAAPSGFDETMAPPPEGADLVTRRRLVRFARTAIRETFEETGLFVADSPQAGGVDEDAGQQPTRGVWRAFERAGLAPAFSRLVLVARAVTPTTSPIRFHTRFFRVDGSTARGALRGDGELEDLRWVTAGNPGNLPMSTVTALVLKEALAHGTETGAGRRPAALFRWVGGSQRPRFAVGPVARQA